MTSNELEQIQRLADANVDRICKLLRAVKGKPEAQSACAYCHEPADADHPSCRAGAMAAEACRGRP